MIKLLKEIIAADKEKRKAYKSYKKGEMSKEEFKKISAKANEKGMIIVIFIFGIFLVIWFFSILLEDKTCYGSYEQDIKILKNLNKDWNYMYTKYSKLDFEKYRYDLIKSEGCLLSHILKEHSDSLTTEDKSKYEFDKKRAIIAMEVYGEKINKQQIEIQKDQEIIQKGEDIRKMIKILEKY